MRLRLDAEPGELRAKGRALVKAIADRLAREDLPLARMLDVASGRRHFDWHGLEIVVEQEQGDIRTWRQPDGREGATRLEYPYGFIRGAAGADGDDYDCFVGPDKDAANVVIVHQNKAPDFLEYDEDKAMLNFSNVHDAKAAYLRHYDDPRFFGAMSVVPVEEFVARLVGATAGDGMFKGGSTLHKGGSTLHKASDAAQYEIAGGSQMGGRAVHTGGTGVNIIAFSPVQLKPETDSRSALDHVKGRKQSEEELAFARVAAGARKEGLKLIMGKKGDDTKVFELINPDFRADAAATVLAEASWERAGLEDRASRFRHPDPPMGRMLMMPASLQKTAELDDDDAGRDDAGRDDDDAAAATADDTAAVGDAAAYGVRAATDAPDVPTVNLDAPPLPRGETHVMKKRGLGAVQLRHTDDGMFEVTIGAVSPVEFSSLSAACDHVWAQQQGYESARAYKDELGVNKVPSGAGWKFWGLAKSGSAPAPAPASASAPSSPTPNQAKAG